MLSEWRKKERKGISWSQSYQTLISSFLQFLLLSLAILKYRHVIFLCYKHSILTKKTEKIFILQRKKFSRIDSKSSSLNNFGLVNEIKMKWLTEQDCRVAFLNCLKIYFWTYQLLLEIDTGLIFPQKQNRGYNISIIKFFFKHIRVN